jgi:acylglycerol lipase
MKHVEGNFKSVRNLNIYYQAWLPDGNVKAVLLVVHGLGEHSGRYMNAVNRFVPLGYALYALDHIGHGKSEGTREFVERFDDYTVPLESYFKMVKAWQPGKPVYLFAHSAGGLIAAYYLIDHQADFKGAVISAPLIKISDDITSTTIAIGKILARLLPKAGLLSLDPHYVSRDPDVVKAYIDDPLVFHGRTTAKLSRELYNAMIRISEEGRKIALPFIVVQGSADRIVNPGAARLLYDIAGSEDKTIKIYEGLYHEVFNEPERDRVLADVETWLNAHA